MAPAYLGNKLVANAYLGTSPVTMYGGSTLIRPSYLAEAEALFARFTTPPTTARKALINDFFRETLAILPHLDNLWLIGADSQASRRNWIKDKYNLTAVSSPVFTADRGFQGDGVAARLATGFIPSTAIGDQFTQLSTTLGVYSRTAAAAASGTPCEVGCALTGTNRLDLRVRFDADVAGFSVNAGASFTGSVVTDGSGFFAAVRRDNTSQRLRRNTVELANSAIGAGGLPTTELSYLAGAVNNWSTRSLCMGFFGASLTNGELDGLYQAALTYLTNIGAV